MKIINKNYQKLLFATVITRFGDAIDTIAFSWLVYVMTGSRALMGTIFAVSIIPNLIILPFSGVIADILDKKIITVLGDVARALSVGILAILYFYGALEVWHIFMFVIVNSIFESFSDPSRGAMLQSLIMPEEFVKGSSYLQTGSTLGSLVGLSMAGLLIANIGISGTIMIDALTFLISGIVILSMKFVDKKEKVDTEETSKIQFFKLVKEGVMYLKDKKFLVSVLILAAFINFSFVPYNVLRPVFVVEVLKLGVEGLSYISVAMLLGILSGSLIMGKFGEKLNPITALGFGFAMLAICYTTLGIAKYTGLEGFILLAFVLVANFFFGFFIPVITAPLRAITMRETKPEMIGRLSSIMSLISLCAIPLGGLFVSLVGDSISVSILFVLMGMFALTISSRFWFKNRKVVLT